MLGAREKRKAATLCFTLRELWAHQCLPLSMARIPARTGVYTELGCLIFGGWLVVPQHMTRRLEKLGEQMLIAWSMLLLEFQSSY